jgi:hypothetical protein
MCRANLSTSNGTAQTNRLMIAAAASSKTVRAGSEAVS